MSPHPEVPSDKLKHNKNNPFVKNHEPGPFGSGPQAPPVCPPGRGPAPPQPHELLIVAALSGRGAACLLLPPLEEPVVRGLQVLDLHLVIVHPHGCQGTGHFLLGTDVGGGQVH